MYIALEATKKKDAPRALVCPVRLCIDEGHIGRSSRRMEPVEASTQNFATPPPIDARACFLATQIVECHNEMTTGSHMHWLIRETSKLMHRDFALSAKEEQSGAAWKRNNGRRQRNGGGGGTQ